MALLSTAAKLLGSLQPTVSDASPSQLEKQISSQPTASDWSQAAKDSSAYWSSAAQVASAKMNGSYKGTDISGNPIISTGSAPKTSPTYTPTNDGGDYYGSPSLLDVSEDADAKSLDYLNADLAKHYGMDEETAYQEALSNTSYQRAVKDMQAAGLNPAALFGSGSITSGAGGVYYPSLYQDEEEIAASGGASGYSRKSGSSTSSKKLFSSGMYNLLQLAGGAVGALATKSVSGYYVGATAARTVMGALNGLLGG